MYYQLEEAAELKRKRAIEARQARHKSLVEARAKRQAQQEEEAQKLQAVMFGGSVASDTNEEKQSIAAEEKEVDEADIATDENAISKSEDDKVDS